MKDRINITTKNHIAHIEMVREDKLNALDDAMFDGLIEAAETVAKQPDLRVVILSGRGRGFCAGLDIANFTEDKPKPELAERTHGIANRLQHVSVAWQELPIPVLAVAHNVCLGGGFHIFMGSDIRYATPDTRFSIMEIKWGLIPDMGAGPLLQHHARADIIKELVFTGRIFDASQAQAYGFLTHIDDDPLKAAFTLAEEITQKNPDAIRADKHLFSQLPYLSKAEGLLLESNLQDKIIGTDNQKEAVMAELEKRPPKFKT